MTQAALSDLNARFSRVYKDFDPYTGGTATDEYEITFRCPTCGPPAIISVRVGPEMREASPRCWQASPAAPPADGSWMSQLTLSPSIDHTQAGHGPRRPPCAFHGHIANGVVVFS